ALAKYPEILPPLLPDGTTIFARGIELGASTLPELWGDQYTSYLKSAYHNEFALANDADDALTAIISLGANHPLPIAGLQSRHGRRESNPNFGGVSTEPICWGHSTA